MMVDGIIKWKRIQNKGENCDSERKKKNENCIATAFVGSLPCKYAIQIAKIHSQNKHTNANSCSIKLKNVANHKIKLRLFVFRIM